MAKKPKIETKDLVARGYFPEELPPVFSTIDLGNSVAKVSSHLHTFIKAHPAGKLLVYSIPKAKGYRRNLGIPHPLQYIQLSKTIADHWKDITALTEQSKISLSRLSPGVYRAISRFAFDEFIDARLHASVGNRFLLKVDITRFYNSVYTHSIPWALHTKTVAKLETSRAKHFGNGLDIDSRNLQARQTIGLPIGPDSSRIISEVILTAMDIALQRLIPNLQGVRIIDDYYLYFKQLSELESARSAIHQVLKEYELELNPSKESIIELPEILETNWYRELKEIRFSNEPATQRKQLISFFDKAFFYSKENPEETVLSYALSKVRPTFFQEENVGILVALMFNAIVQESKTISICCEILTSFYQRKFSLDRNLLSTALNEFIIFHAHHDHEYELSWAMWTVKNLELELSKSAAERISKNTNSLIVLLALDLKRNKRIPSGLDTSLWKSMLTADNLHSEHWLLAYEVKVRAWLRTADDYLEKDPFFKVLKDHKVRFYQPAVKVDVSKVRVSAGSASVPVKAERIRQKVIKPAEWDDLFNDGSVPVQKKSLKERIAELREDRAKRAAEPGLEDS